MTIEAITEIKTQLVSLGFEAKYDHQDSDLHYEVLESTFVEVTLAYTEGKIYYNVNTQDEEFPFTTMKEMFLLISVLRKGQHIKNQLVSKTEADV